MRIARVLGVGVLVSVMACGGDGGGDPPTGTAVYTTLDVQPATVSLSVNGTQALTTTARDQNNATMSGLTVAYQSSDASRATVTQAGLVTAVANGTATITVTGTVGGVVKTRTINVTVAPPGQTATVTATGNSTFDPQNVTIVAAGTVTWTFQLLHNVTWDGAAPTGGTIGDTSTGNVSRTFPTAGTYNYRCTIHAGMTGRVTVQ